LLSFSFSYFALTKLFLILLPKVKEGFVRLPNFAKELYCLFILQFICFCWHWPTIRLIWLIIRLIEPAFISFIKLASRLFLLIKLA